MRTGNYQNTTLFNKAACLIWVLSVISGCSTINTASANINTRATTYAAIVVDANTGKTLFSAHADTPRYPASLTKMMTLYLLFEAIHTGQINKNTLIPISPYAASRPPLKLGIRPGQSIAVEAAILALITKSANDIAAAVGEYLGGSETHFAQMMTAKARRLGMNKTTFRNASGLPDQAQRTSARDMAILGIALRKHFAREFAYFSTRSFVYRGQTIKGHNKLLGRIRGMDGIKTGYIRESGYNLVSSVNFEGRKLIAVVMGGKSSAARDVHMVDLIARYLPHASRHVDKEILIAVHNTSPIEAGKPNLQKDKPVPLPIFRSDIVVDNHQEEATLPKPTVFVATTPAHPTAIETIDDAIASVSQNSFSENIDSMITTSAYRDGSWAIQIGSLPSQEQAQDTLSRASAEAGSVLQLATAQTAIFEKKSATFYRARFVGFKTKTAAWNACATLQKQNFGCFILAQEQAAYNKF